MGYPEVPVYKAIETFVHKATATDASNGYVEFTMPRPITGVIVNIFSSAGVANTAGLKATITTTTGASASCKVKVEATAITANDVITLIAV